MPGHEDNPPQAFSRQAIRTLDRLAVEQYAMPSIVLMENAGRSVAELALAELGKNTSPAVIACGPGNNGGDGLVAARWLHNAGRQVAIALAADPSRLVGDAGANLAIVKAMGLPLVLATPGTTCVESALVRVGSPALLIDALLGTGVAEPVRGGISMEIDQINRQREAGQVRRVLSIDLPSGMDADTGLPAGGGSCPCVCADLTLTLVGYKAGFRQPASARWTGGVHVGDIGVPRELGWRVADR